MLIWFMNQIYLFFILVCCVQSYLLFLRFMIAFFIAFNLIARIDRLQTQRN